MLAWFLTTNKWGANAMRRLAISAVLLGILAGPAYAQNSKGDDAPIMLDEKAKKKDAEAIDKRYQSALEKTRKQSTEPRADPWSNMRGADDSKTKR